MPVGAPMCDSCGHGGNSGVRRTSSLLIGALIKAAYRPGRQISHRLERGRGHGTAIPGPRVHRHAIWRKSRRCLPPRHRRPRTLRRLGQAGSRSTPSETREPSLRGDPIYAHLVRPSLTRHRLDAPRSRRTAAVAAIGPLIMLAGVLWAITQPDRLPLLDPDAHGFWSLAVEPPLLVLLAGIFFHRFIASGLIHDLCGSEVG